MTREQYELTKDYQKSLEIVRKFIDEVLGGDIENLRKFCFEDLTTGDYETDFVGEIQDPDMYLITQAIYIILWGDIYDLTFENMGSWNWDNEHAFRGDTMNSFNSVLGKMQGNVLASRARFYDADKNPELWKKIEEFNRMYHYIGNFIVIPNRGSVSNGINGARGDYNFIRDYFDWFLILLCEYQKKLEQGNTCLNHFEKQLQMNPEYNPEFLRIEGWEKEFFLNPYFANISSDKREPKCFFKTPLEDRLKTTDPNGKDPNKTYFEKEEYLELMEDYIDKSKEVIEYRTDRIIKVLKNKVF